MLLSVGSRMGVLKISLPPDRLVQLSRRRLSRHYGVARSPGLPRNGHLTLRDIRAAALSLTSLATVTLVYVRWLHVTTVALTFLLVVLITAATSRLRVAVITSIASMLCFHARRNSLLSKSQRARRSASPETTAPITRYVP